MTEASQRRFVDVALGLEAAGITFKRNHGLVRGLDYYRHTTFEFVTDRLGAQGPVLAGGRYDGLIEALGGPHTPAVGWAAGIERLAMMIDAPVPEKPELAIVVGGDAGELRAHRVAAAARSAGIASVRIDTGNPKKRMQRAVATGAKFAAFVQFEIENLKP